MKCRSGFYVHYKGKEYEADMNALDETITLRSSEPQEAANGFAKIKETLFKKTVPETDVEAAYNITTFAEFKGHTFQLDQNSFGEWHLLYDGRDQDIVRDYRFQLVDRFFYVKKVEIQELNRVWEEKKDVPID